MEERFDRQLAEKSLRIFSADLIPSVDRRVPSEVSDVRFRVDLSGADPVDPGLFRRQGGLFQQASPDSMGGLTGESV